MDKVLISVIMPVYNGGQYLREAMDSILSQTYTNFEFIIINDGSTDKSEEIILSYNDNRIVYIKNEVNMQIVKTLNKGINLAKGSYIVRMDSDDISLPQRFEQQLSFMIKNPEIDVCGTWIKTFGIKEQIWKYPVFHEDIKVRLIFESSLAHPSVMFKKDFFDKFKYEDTYNKAEDYALWVNSINEKRFHNIPSVLLKYRLHNKQTDKKVQNNITNNIRFDLLNKVMEDISNEEKDIFMKIVLKKDFDISKVELFLIKIIKENKKTKIFNELVLIKFLSIKYFEYLTEKENQNCFKNISSFYSSFLKKYIDYTNSLYWKVLIKCFIRDFYAK